MLLEGLLDGSDDIRALVAESLVVIISYANSNSLASPSSSPVETRLWLPSIGFKLWEVLKVLRVFFLLHDCISVNVDSTCVHL